MRGAARWSRVAKPYACTAHVLYMPKKGVGSTTSVRRPPYPAWAPRPDPLRDRRSQSALIHSASGRPQCTDQPHRRQATGLRNKGDGNDRKKREKSEREPSSIYNNKSNKGPPWFDGVFDGFAPVGGMARRKKTRNLACRVCLPPMDVCPPTVVPRVRVIAGGGMVWSGLK